MSLGWYHGVVSACCMIVSASESQKEAREVQIADGVAPGGAAQRLASHCGEVGG